MSDWVKATTSGWDGNCVEVTASGPRVLVRDSHQPDVVLSLTAADWAAFLDGAQRGEFAVGRCLWYRGCDRLVLTAQADYCAEHLLFVRTVAGG